MRRRKAWSRPRAQGASAGGAHSVPERDFVPLPVKRRRSTIAVCIPLIGCLNGDFGRVRPSLVTDDMHAWIGARANVAAGQVPSEFQLTDDERLLRDLAYPLIAPPYDRARWFSVLEHYGQNDLSPNIAPEIPDYTAALMWEWRRSPVSLYARLKDDIRNDVERIGPFEEVARRVSDMDVKRRKSLAYVTGLTPYEATNAVRRMEENRLTVLWVHKCLVERVASYRFAMERIVISTPDMAAVEVERSLTLLRARLAQYRIIPPPAVAVAAPAVPLVTKD
jgi:hypothetical protein